MARAEYGARIGECPLLWLRGLVPWRDCYGPLVVADDTERVVGSLVGGPRVVYTDGSGAYPKDQRKRLCAWSAVWEGGSMSGPLPGLQHTVFRSEIYALCRVLECHQGHVEIVSDCLGVVDRALFLLWGGQVRPKWHHADLWHRISRSFFSRSERGLATEVRWVPAHVPREEAGGPKISLQDWLGNAAADELAKEALLLHPDQSDRNAVIDRYDTLALGVLRLGMSVYSAVVQERQEQGVLPPPRHPLRVQGVRRPRPPREWPWEVMGAFY